MRDDRITKKKQFISGSQVVKDQKKDHQREGWTVLKKLSEEPMYPSNSEKQQEDKNGDESSL